MKLHTAMKRQVLRSTGKDVCPVMTDIFFAEIEDAVDYGFHEILDAAGDKFYGTLRVKLRQSG
jgi:hypothetical protein